MKSWHRVIVENGNQTNITERYESPRSALQRAEQTGGRVEHRDHRGNWVKGPAQSL